MARRSTTKNPRRRKSRAKKNPRPSRLHQAWLLPSLRRELRSQRSQRSQRSHRWRPSPSVPRCRLHQQLRHLHGRCLHRQRRSRLQSLEMCQRPRQKRRTQLGRVGRMVMVICGYRVMESENEASPTVSKAWNPPAAVLSGWSSDQKTWEICGWIMLQSNPRTRTCNAQNFECGMVWYVGLSWLSGENSHAKKTCIESFPHLTGGRGKDQCACTS